MFGKQHANEACVQKAVIQGFCKSAMLMSGDCVLCRALPALPLCSCKCSMERLILTSCAESSVEGSKH